MNTPVRKLTHLVLVTGMGLSLAWAQPAAPAAGDSASPAAGDPPAAASPAVESEEETKLEFKGYTSQSYSINTNQPSNGQNQFRSYDFDDRKLKLDLVNLNFQYGVDKPGEAGFRLDLTGGYSHPKVDAALGLFRDYNTGLSNTHFDIRQAYVTYTAPNGLRFDVGKWATPIGYEVMDGVDGANAHATRSWAFLYGPFTHTGAKVSYPICDELVATAYVTTGWDQFRDANGSLSAGGQILYKPGENFNIAFNFISGPERFQNDQSNRRLFDVTANWKVHEKINLGFNAISGVDDDFISPQVHGSWNGLTLYMQNELADKVNLNFRYEAFNDPVGARTGVGQRLRGFTITPEYRIDENWLIRADIRFDSSDQLVFDKEGGLTSKQTTFMFNNVVRF